MERKEGVGVEKRENGRIRKKRITDKKREKERKIEKEKTVRPTRQKTEENY